MSAVKTTYICYILDVTVDADPWKSEQVQSVTTTTTVGVALHLHTTQRWLESPSIPPQWKGRAWQCNKFGRLDDDLMTWHHRCQDVRRVTKRMYLRVNLRMKTNRVMWGLSFFSHYPHTYMPTKRSQILIISGENKGQVRQTCLLNHTIWALELFHFLIELGRLRHNPRRGRQFHRRFVSAYV